MRTRTPEEIERREIALKEVMRIIIETNETMGDAKQFVGNIYNELMRCSDVYLNKARTEDVLREMETREERVQRLLDSMRNS